MEHTTNPNELIFVADRKKIERAYLKREILIYLSVCGVSSFHIKNSFEAGDGFWPFGIAILLLVCLFIKATIKTASLYTIVVFRKIDIDQIDITYRGMRSEPLKREELSFQSNPKTNVLRILLNGENAIWMFLSAFKELEERYSEWISKEYVEETVPKEEPQPVPQLKPLAQMKEAFQIISGKHPLSEFDNKLTEEQKVAQRKVNKLFAVWKIIMLLFVPLFLSYGVSLLILQDFPLLLQATVSLIPAIVLFYILHKLFFFIHAMSIGPVAIWGQKILDKANPKAPKDSSYV